MNQSDNAVGMLIGIEPDTRLYRVFPTKYLFALFKERRNVLVQPQKWEDPWENFVLRAPVKLASGERGTFAFHDDLYGQCWTRHTASDAMWRIYSPRADAVRVCTTAGKLLASLSVNLGDWAPQQAFLGKVEYLSQKKLEAFARTVFSHGITAEGLARSVFVKRRAFVHEREVRLVYIEKDTVKHPEGLFRYAVDPHQLIDQIMIDPRMPYETFNQVRDEIVRRTGFTGPIKRSLLYARPKGFVVELP